MDRKIDHPQTVIGTTATQDAPTVDALLQDCHRLLNQVARRPNAVKHLLYLHQAIGQFAAYKAKRRVRSPRQRVDSN